MIAESILQNLGQDPKLTLSIDPATIATVLRTRRTIPLKVLAVSEYRPSELRSIFSGIEKAVLGYRTKVFNTFL